MILVTGATGTVGSEVVRLLVAAGQTVRAFVRSPQKASQKLRGLNVEQVQGQFESADTLRKALDGVDRLFLLSSGAQNLEANEPRVVEEAKRYGVKHVVKLSVMGADRQPGITLERLHRGVEKKLESSGMKWTFLRPSAFMSNMLNNAASIKQQGKFFGPFGKGKLAYVDPRDVAAVAAKVLAGPSGHEGKAYVLTGAEALTQAQVAEKLARAVGRKVEFVDVPAQMAKQGMLHVGLPAPAVEMVLELAALIRDGKAGAVTQEVERITGSRPRTFDAWAKENAAAFR
jgi:uncharacterized protein YbjT (DUF2867 family)